jgi:hypothetical protein
VTNACYIIGKSTQRCKDEGLNLKNTVLRHKMNLKPCSVFFLKQHDYLKIVILNKELQLITKHLNLISFSHLKQLKINKNQLKVRKISKFIMMRHINFSVKKYFKSKKFIIMDHSF